MVLTKNQSCGTAVVASLMLCVGLAVTGLSFAMYSHSPDTPPSQRLYWVGIPMAVPGIVGIVTAVTRSHIAMAFYLFFCICACILSGIGSVIIGLAAYVIVDANDCQVQVDGCYCWNHVEDKDILQIPGTCEALKYSEHILFALTVLCILSFILSLIGSIFGCVGTCCSRKQTSEALVNVGDRHYIPQRGQVYVTTMQSPISDHMYAGDDSSALLA